MIFARLTKPLTLPKTTVAHRCLAYILIGLFAALVGHVRLIYSSEGASIVPKAHFGFSHTFVNLDDPADRFFLITMGSPDR